MLSRPESAMHQNLFLYLDWYPHLRVPPAECWEKLDNAMRYSHLVIHVDRAYRLPNSHEPTVWGRRYGWERRDWWLAEARRLFRQTYQEGRLWATDSCGVHTKAQVSTRFVSHLICIAIVSDLP